MSIFAISFYMYTLSSTPFRPIPCLTVGGVLVSATRTHRCVHQTTTDFHSVTEFIIAIYNQTAQNKGHQVATRTITHKVTLCEGSMSQREGSAMPMLLSLTDLCS